MHTHRQRLILTHVGTHTWLGLAFLFQVFFTDFVFVIGFCFGAAAQLCNDKTYWQRNNLTIQQSHSTYPNLTQPINPLD